MNTQGTNNNRLTRKGFKALTLQLEETTSTMFQHLNHTQDLLLGLIKSLNDELKITTDPREKDVISNQIKIFTEQHDTLASKIVKLEQRYETVAAVLEQEAELFSDSEEDDEEETN